MLLFLLFCNQTSGAGSKNLCDYETAHTKHEDLKINIFDINGYL